jgi:tRNA threonylcarbamoyladenosine biosynthesis protein TsaB
MILLALDTATESCSAAVSRNGEILARRFERLRRGQAERLVPMIEEVMAEAHADYRALDGIVATVGPGSFTGVRVGLAAARGLALAAGVPLVGVSTLEAVAAAVPAAERHGRTVLAALDAARGRLYAQWFAADGAPLSPPIADHADEIAARRGNLAGTVLVGSGAAAIERALGPAPAGPLRSSAPDWPEAATLGRLVWRRAAAGGGIAALAQGEVRPLYLKEPGVTSPSAPDAAVRA